jgi:hypothetical protein
LYLFYLFITQGVVDSSLGLFRSKYVTVHPRKAPSDDAANTAAVITAGALPPLAELLRGGSNEGNNKNAAAALGNLVRNDTANKAAVITAGALPQLEYCQVAIRHLFIHVDTVNYSLTSYVRRTDVRRTD